LSRGRPTNPADIASSNRIELRPNCREAPEIMKGFAEAFTDRATGITGDPE
tara:strand:- start:17868 stop:18020 length:153 start_codon:yes stop_codon:yes gene_type:complete